MIDILTSEFFWGIVVGLVLSLLGGWALARLNVTSLRRLSTENQKELAVELISNIKKYAVGLDEARDRSKVIYKDFFDLIVSEIAVYSRNRENLVLIPKEAREALQKFMTDVASYQARTHESLAHFNEVYRVSDTARSNGDADTADLAATSANQHLQNAHATVDRLVSKAKEADTVVHQIRAS